MVPQCKPRAHKATQHSSYSSTHQPDSASAVRCFRPPTNRLDSSERYIAASTRHSSDDVSQKPGRHTKHRGIPRKLHEHNRYEHVFPNASPERATSDDPFVFPVGIIETPSPASVLMLLPCEKMIRVVRLAGTIPWQIYHVDIYYTVGAIPKKEGRTTTTRLPSPPRAKGLSAVGTNPIASYSQGESIIALPRASHTVLSSQRTTRVLEGPPTTGTRTGVLNIARQLPAQSIALSETLAGEMQRDRGLRRYASPVRGIGTLRLDPCGLISVYLARLVCSPTVECWRCSVWRRRHW